MTVYYREIIQFESVQFVRFLLLSVFLTSVVFIPPVSTSHTRMVWSHDALQTSSLSHHRTEETASLCPDNVIRGVCVGVRKHVVFDLCISFC